MAQLVSYLQIYFNAIYNIIKNASNTIYVKQKESFKKRRNILKINYEDKKYHSLLVGVVNLGALKVFKFFIKTHIMHNNAKKK